MLPSCDGFAFGYVEFYNDYLSVPFNRALVEFSGIPLPSPAVFSVRDPLHVAVAAQHGHQIFPVNEADIKTKVNDGEPYARNVEARMAEFRQMVAAHNAHQDKFSMFAGGAVKIVIEDTPFTIEEFESVGLGESVIAHAATQFEKDREFFRLGRSGRLNHFAKEYGFPNLKALTAHLQKVDQAAQHLGIPSYAVLCTTSRYIDHVLARSEGDPAMTAAIGALRKQRVLLTRESVFLVECFIACRVTEADTPFYVEVLEDGVSIEVRNGPRAGKAIIGSRRRSDKQSQIHVRWFA